MPSSTGGEEPPRDPCGGAPPCRAHPGGPQGAVQPLGRALLTVRLLQTYLRPRPPRRPRTPRSPPSPTLADVLDRVRREKERVRSQRGRPVTPFCVYPLSKREPEAPGAKGRRRDVESLQSDGRIPVCRTSTPGRPPASARFGQGWSAGGGAAGPAPTTGKFSEQNRGGAPIASVGTFALI